MGTRCPSPCRCFRSTTRWVIERATGSTTTRLRSPHTPSLPATSLPMMYSVTVLICWPFVGLVVLPWMRTHRRQPYLFPRTPWRVSRFRGCSHVTLEIAQREPLGAEAAIPNELGRSHPMPRPPLPTHERNAGVHVDGVPPCPRHRADRALRQTMRVFAPKTGGGADLFGSMRQLAGRCLKPETPPAEGWSEANIDHTPQIQLFLDQSAARPQRAR